MTALGEYEEYQSGIPKTDSRREFSLYGSVQRVLITDAPTEIYFGKKKKLVYMYLFRNEEK